MKKIILILFLLISTLGKAQDTTIATLSIRASLVEVVAGFVRGNDDTAYVNLLYKWASYYRTNGVPPGSTQVSVDSVPVNVIAAIYRRASNFSQGSTEVLTPLQADILTIRNGNAYLDRLLDQIDDREGIVVPIIRIVNRRLLTGRN